MGAYRYERHVRRRTVGFAVFALAVIATLGTVPAAADLVSRPSVEGESVSNITPTDATLEAQINPGGLETSYEFRLETPECQMMAGPGPMVGCEQVGAGKIPPGSSTATVSTDIAKTWQKLTPNTTYLYVVFAKNAVGSAEGRHEASFTTPPTGTAPVIDSVSLSHLTPTDATLEARINTEDLETTYEFHMVGAYCEWPCESPEYLFTLPAGKLLGSFVGQNVSLDLNSAGVKLMPINTYWVTATSAAGTTEGPSHTFRSGEGGVQPLTTTPPAGSHSTTGPASNAWQGTVAPDATNSVNNLAPSPKVTALTSAQKLGKAVKVCKRKPRKQRAGCVKQAKKKYGSAGKRAK
jgi:hypothetical protein